jgi:beta-glucosidase
MHPIDFMAEARALVAQMSLEEKTGLCSGASFWTTKSLARPGILPLLLSDGPHGLRKQSAESDHLGMGAAVPATCFPAAGTLAQAWDPELCRQMGEALAAECVAEGVAVILGPGINIKRNPLGGRNFEYFSEDPYLTGALAAAFIRGVQSRGVGTSLKHFAANQQEHFRMVVDTLVDEHGIASHRIASHTPLSQRGRATMPRPYAMRC